jgi:hypothetical protein
LTKLVIYEVLWRTELLQKRYDSFKCLQMRLNKHWEGPTAKDESHI